MKEKIGQMFIYLNDRKEFSAECKLNDKNQAEMFRVLWEFYKLNKIEIKED